MSWAELLGFLTGGACVWLTVRRHIANFPVGLANSALFLVLFCSARLWADGLLQVVYLVLGMGGWWQWQHGRDGRDDSARLRIGTAGRAETAACVAFVVAGTSVLTVVLRAADDVAPFWDALTTSLSLAAQWLLNRRRLQTWFFWIAADAVYIPLYATKHLVLTAVVYVLFLGLCVGGLREWLASRRGDRTAAPVDAVTAR